MQSTKNYSLSKPELTDVADITPISTNMQIIDDALGNHDNMLDKLKNAGGYDNPIYLENGVPKLCATSLCYGMIVMWSGTLANIPEGWHVCDGQSGTPDLRDKFIVGAGSSYVVGATGGEASHTLTVNEMPSHAHARGTMNITGRLYGEAGGGSNYNTYEGAFYETNAYGTSNVGSGDTDYDNGRIYFDASRSWTGVTSYVGGGKAHENRPPYYALFFIMRISGTSSEGDKKYTLGLYIDEDGDIAQA